jgi:hypothetical protein
VHYAEIPHRLADVINIPLKGELRGVDADYLQTLVLISLVPRIEIWESALTIDTAIGHEIYQNHFFADQFANGNAIGVHKTGWIHDLFVRTQGATQATGRIQENKYQTCGHQDDQYPTNYVFRLHVFY